MIKFFRKIRQRLLSENRFSKYLLYAIGEILLVMIGILLALQVNNWNESKKAKKFEHKILSDIKTSLQGNYFTLNMAIDCNKNAISAGNIILKHLKENLPYHDSLAVHFSDAISYCTPSLSNAGYQSLKSYGLHIVTNDSIRERFDIFENGWIETLDGRQEDYFSNTATPILTQFFDKVAMRTKMKPNDYAQLRNSNQYLTVLNTSLALREDQNHWYEMWLNGYQELEKKIEAEINALLLNE